MFVGQAPSKKTVGQAALSGRSGAVLADMLDLDQVTFLNRFVRVNLNREFCEKREKSRGDSFDQNEGESRAQLLLGLGLRRFVLLGSKVSTCFGIVYEPLKLISTYDSPHNREFLILPHPSGLNHWYNDKKNKVAAKIALTKFVYE